eukprot:6492651-Amphidinium_carterae.2
METIRKHAFVCGGLELIVLQSGRLPLPCFYCAICQEQQRLRWLSEVVETWTPARATTLLPWNGVEVELHVHCKPLPAEGLYSWIDTTELLKPLGLSCLGGQTAKWVSQRWGAWQKVSSQWGLPAHALLNSFRADSRSGHDHTSPDGRLAATAAIVPLLLRMGAHKGRDCLHSAADREKVTRLVAHMIWSACSSGYLNVIDGEVQVSNMRVNMRSLARSLPQSAHQSVLLEAQHHDEDIENMSLVVALHCLEVVAGASKLRDACFTEIGKAVDVHIHQLAVASGETSQHTNKTAIEKHLFRYLSGHRRHFSKQRAISIALDATRLGQKPCWAGAVVDTGNVGMLFPPQVRSVEQKNGNILSQRDITEMVSPFKKSSGSVSVKGFFRFTETQ